MHTQEKSDQLYTSISFVYTKKQPEAYNIIYQVAVYANRTDMYIIKKIVTISCFITSKQNQRQSAYLFVQRVFCRKAVEKICLNY